MEGDGWRLDDAIISWIQKNIPLGSRILELGSGEGSDLIVKAGYKVTSVEHDEEWLNKFPGVDYIHAPLRKHKPLAKVESGTHEWYDKDVIAAIPHDYSLIIVDGPPGCYGRSGFLKYLRMFDTSVPVLLDDLHRNAEMFLATRVAAKLKRPLTVYCHYEGANWGVL